MTTMKTRWGESTVTVSADFAQASAAIEGLEGLQVADVRHSPQEALRQAVYRAAFADGSSHAEDCETDASGFDETCRLCADVEKAVEAATRS